MKILVKLKNHLTSRKKTQEHKDLINVLRRPENQQRRPAAKFASNRSR
jgi:hypothetical protein